MIVDIWSWTGQKAQDWHWLWFRAASTDTCVNVKIYSHGVYFPLSSFPSCSSPRNFTASMMAAQVAGGSTRSSHVSSISTRQLCGSRWNFSAMLASFPLGISRYSPIVLHLSATLWYRASIRSFNCGLLGFLSVPPPDEKHLYITTTPLISYIN